MECFNNYNNFVYDAKFIWLWVLSTSRFGFKSFTKSILNH